MSNERQEELDEQQSVDPHASKIPSDDPRLQIPKTRSRTLKKGPVIALTVVLVGAIFLAIMMAVQPPKKAVKAEKKDETSVSNQLAIPDIIRQGPDNNKPVTLPDTSITASVPDYVPELGKPLPGDLGHAMVNKQNGRYQGSGSSQQYNQPDPVEQERHAAVTSSPFFGGAAVLRKRGRGREGVCFETHEKSGKPVRSEGGIGNSGHSGYRNCLRFAGQCHRHGERERVRYRDRRLSADSAGNKGVGQIRQYGELRSETGASELDKDVTSGWIVHRAGKYAGC